MAREAAKQKGPTCACGRVDLYMESLKQKDEIAMRICSHQPKMIMWLFHLANKK